MAQVDWAAVTKAAFEAIRGAPMDEEHLWYCPACEAYGLEPPTEAPVTIRTCTLCGAAIVIERRTEKQGDEIITWYRVERRARA